MLEYAALVVSPRALPDGLILVFQHPVNTEPTDPRIPHREEFHELVLGTLPPKAGKRMLYNPDTSHVGVNVTLEVLL